MLNTPKERIVAMICVTIIIVALIVGMLLEEGSI